MDLGHMTVVAWCIHQDLILVEKILFVPEPDVVILRGPPLFVDPKEVIFHNQPTLWMFIDIIKIEDWHTLSVSLSNGGSDSGSDGDDYIRPAFFGPWPKRTCFSDDLPNDGKMEDDGLAGGVGEGGSCQGPASDGGIREDASFMVGSVLIPWMPMTAADGNDGGDCMLPLREGSLSLGDRLDPMLIKASAQPLMARHTNMVGAHPDWPVTS
jgi:hypothetical protein